MSGLGALMAHTALPAWGQFSGGIRPQNDPWAQVDPYADPRNGFPSNEPVHRQTETPLTRTFGQTGALSPDDADEVELGYGAYPGRVKNSGGAHPNKRLQQALREFCEPMFAVSDRPNLPWVVTLVDNPDPNASAGAGGTVIVHTGILALYDHPGELAATLAHEIGHVDKRHVLRSMDVSRAVAQLRKDGVKPAGGNTMTTLAPEAEGVFRDYYDLLSRVYRKENEAEADAHEMVILERLGVDPIHAINDQKKFLKFEQLIGGSSKDSWTRSHPPTPERLKHIEGLAGMGRRPRQEFVFDSWEVLKAPFPTRPQFRTKDL